MHNTINCFDCKKLAPLQEDDTKCPICGSTNIEIISKDRLTEGLDAGVFFSFDAKGKKIKYK